MEYEYDINILECENVNKIINSDPLNKDNYYDISLIERILSIMIDKGYVMQKENYKQMLKKISIVKNHHNGKFYNKFSSKKVLSNFEITEETIEEWINFIKDIEIKVFNFNFTSLNIKNKNNAKYLFYFFCSFEKFENIFIRDILKIMDYNNISISIECLKYIKNWETKHYVFTYLTKPKKPNDIKISKSDDTLINCKTISELDKFVEMLELKVSPNTIIGACRKDINIDHILYMISHKLSFEEEEVNDIIRSYINNTNLEKILLAINSSSYVFTESNFEEMFRSPIFHLLFNRHILLKSNLDVNEQFLENALIAKTQNPQLFKTFLNNFNELKNINEKWEKTYFLLKKLPKDIYYYIKNKR
jgi:hypothetical protein